MLPYVANPVFVSHTGRMKDFASRAIDAVLQTCNFPRDMRFFNAESDTPAKVCEQEVEKCAIYVGVFGHDYGSPVRDRPDISYTQLEFLTALAKSKRGQMKVFAFVLAGDPTDDRQRRFIDEVYNSGI